MTVGSVKTPAPYFVNAPFDVSFVGGISIATYILLWQFGPSGESDRALQILLALVWVVNYPHFSATLYRLFRTRENADQYPLTAYFLPFIVLAGTVAALAWPRTFAPYFVKLMLLWSSYHFSGQTLGITMIYARRHGIVFEAWERRAVSLFIFSTYLVFMVQVGNLGGSYYGIDHPTVEVPAWFPAVVRWAMWAAGGFLVAFIVSWSMRERRVFPLIVMLPAIAQFVWFVPGLNAVNFFIFVPLFHSLQYLPIALAMHLGDSIGEGSERRSPRRMAIETVKWCGLNLVGGVLLFFSLPYVVASFGVDFAIATGVIAAAIQLHHFVVDGVIWKLRNANVASPLMLNLRDYSKTPA